ncbi:MAG: hypothetical protein DHS80DRAFT_32534 [Piptocephalis tieghemiana]|nr:MAG: hypothetical protein DHS80DRAFT_32534 [Piptocephalis tieghemiana]
MDWNADLRKSDPRDSERWSATSFSQSPCPDSIYDYSDRKDSTAHYSQAEIFGVQRAFRQPVLRRRRSSIIPPPPSVSAHSGPCVRRHSLLDSMDGDASSITSFPDLPTSEHSYTSQGSLYQVSLGSNSTEGISSRSSAPSDAQVYQHPAVTVDPSTWSRPPSGPYALRSRAMSTAPGSLAPSISSNSSYSLSTPPDTSDRKSSHLTSLIDAMPHPGDQSLYEAHREERKEEEEEEDIDALYRPAVISGSATMDFLDNSLASDKTPPTKQYTSKAHVVHDHASPHSTNYSAQSVQSIDSHHEWNHEEGQDNALHSEREMSWYARSIRSNDSSASSMFSVAFGPRRGVKVPVHTTPRSSYPASTASFSASSTSHSSHEELRVEMGPGMDRTNTQSTSYPNTACPPGPSPSINLSSLSSRVVEHGPEVKETSLTSTSHPKFIQGRKNYRIHLAVTLLIESVLCISVSTVIATIYPELQWVAYVLVAIFVLLLCPVHALRYRSEIAALQAQIQVDTAFSRSNTSRSITTVSAAAPSYSATDSYISSMYSQDPSGEDVRHEEVDSGCEEVDVEKGLGESHRSSRHSRRFSTASASSYDTEDEEGDPSRNSFPSSFRRNTEAALDAIHDLYLARSHVALPSRSE